MVVEFIAGGTLGSLIEKGKPFDEQFALTVMADAVRGLSIAHARGIVHRDFKPDNVLLTSETRQWLLANKPYVVDGAQSNTPPIGKVYAKVSDFGLARTAQQSESMAMTRDGALLGITRCICRLNSVAVNRQAWHQMCTLWGITLFQLLSGRPPFEGRYASRLAQPTLQRRPPVAEATSTTSVVCDRTYD